MEGRLRGWEQLVCQESLDCSSGRSLGSLFILLSSLLSMRLGASWRFKYTGLGNASFTRAVHGAVCRQLTGQSCKRCDGGTEETADALKNGGKRALSDVHWVIGLLLSAEKKVTSPRVWVSRSAVTESILQRKLLRKVLHIGNQYTSL